MIERAKVPLIRAVTVEALRRRQLYKGYEQDQVDRENTPWPAFNSPWETFQKNTMGVLEGKSLPWYIKKLHKYHKHLVALNIGSNDNPLQPLMKPGDIAISVGLQDFRTDGEKKRDEENGFYFIPGSIGTPDTIKDIRSLLRNLHTQGKIDDPSCNFIMGDMSGGWSSLPLEKDDATGHIPSEAFPAYQEWLAGSIVSVLTQHRGLLLMTFPEKFRENIKTLISKAPSLQAFIENNEHGDASALKVWSK